jgi:hypothetical protein
MANSRTHSDRRSDHRTRVFFDGISALDIAVALLIEAIEHTRPDVTRLFLKNMTQLLVSEEGLTAGTRTKLSRLIRAVIVNNKKRPH